MKRETVLKVAGCVGWFTSALSVSAVVWAMFAIVDAQQSGDCGLGIAFIGLFSATAAATFGLASISSGVYQQFVLRKAPVETQLWAKRNVRFFVGPALLALQVITLPTLFFFVS